MKIIGSDALFICLAASALQNACAFTTSQITHGVRPLIQRNRNRMAPLYSNNDGSDNLRDEIERMKKEARDKLNALDDKMSTMSSGSDDSNTVMESTASNSNTSTSPLTPIKEDNETEEEYMERRLVERMAVSNNPAYTTVLPTSTRQRDEDLLDGTNWKLSFDIGREPGTWMPKDWGVSGDRLKLAFEFEFSDQQLYEREEFLGSAGDAKVISVKDSKMILAPSITQGTKDVKVKGGGWRVSRGKGPMGSDLLRFYVEER